MSHDWTAAHEKVADEGVCRYCASSGPLDPAHIVPRSRGGDMDALNIVPLCRTHHTAYDAGQLELLGRLTVQEQAHAAGLVGLAEAFRRTTVAA